MEMQHRLNACPYEPGDERFRDRSISWGDQGKPFCPQPIQHRQPGAQVAIGIMAGIRVVMKAEAVFLNGGFLRIYRYLSRVVCIG